MPQYNRNRYPYSQYDRRGPMSFRREEPLDYYTGTGRDIYVEDENMSGHMTPMGYDYRGDEYGYDYEAMGPGWQYDSDNDYGLYSPDRVYDYGSHGASGYSGPYFGHPYQFAGRQRAINHQFRPMPDRYGRYQAPPLDFGDHRGHYPDPYYNPAHFGRPVQQDSYRNFDDIPHDRNYYRRPQERYYR